LIGTHQRSFPRVRDEATEEEEEDAAPLSLFNVLLNQLSSGRDLLFLVVPPVLEPKVPLRFLVQMQSEYPRKSYVVK
jgi:hypothetical protein